MQRILQLVRRLIQDLHKIELVNCFFKLSWIEKGALVSHANLIVPCWAKHWRLKPQRFTPCHGINLFISHVLSVLHICHLLNEFLHGKSFYILDSDSSKGARKFRHSQQTSSTTSSVPNPFFSWLTMYWKRHFSSMERCFLQLLNFTGSEYE
jgi:hypothetical protein